MNANDFRQNLRRGGARSNRFDVGITFPSFVPGGVVSGSQIRFRAKATQTPAMTVGTIEIPYQGRIVKVPGDRTYEEWNVTIINDEDYALRNAFEAWQDAISRMDHDTTGDRAPEAAGINDFIADIVVRQRTKDVGGITKQYMLKNAWPTNVAPIELSWDNQDAIEEFDVTFAFDYFVTNGVDSAGNLGDGAFSVFSDLT